MMTGIRAVVGMARKRSIYLEPVELGQAKVEVDAVWGLTNRQAHTLFSVPSDHDVIAIRSQPNAIHLRYVGIVLGLPCLPIACSF
jgi:hypothetical protein